MQMRFYESNTDGSKGFQVTGILRLVEGNVVVDDAATERFIADWVVVEPNKPDRQLTVAEGFDYLRAVPYNLRAQRSWAGWDHGETDFPGLAVNLERLRMSPSTSSVPGSLPVLFFGDFPNARVATIALNPSDREYLDRHRTPLNGSRRRFASLETYGAASREELREVDVVDAIAWMRAYFQPGRPAYWAYFSHLERMLRGAGYGYQTGSAVHLDLIQEPTTPVWRYLPRDERENLLVRDLPFLVEQLRARPFEAVFCNGKTVSDTLAQHLDLTRTQEGTYGRVRWWMGHLDLGDRNIPAVGWNYPLNQSTGLDGVGQTAFGEVLRDALAGRE